MNPPSLLASFIGAFHPLLVHLPIGILMAAIGIDVWTIRRTPATLRVALPLLYGAGALTAILSCISGYILSREGTYDGSLVQRHQWLGMATAFLSTILWLRHRGYLLRVALGSLVRLLPLAVFILLTLTGHYGGSLTHGEGYLLKDAPAFLQKIAGYSPEADLSPSLADVQQAGAYKDVAAVIFRQKCVSCHGPNKQKGGLRLDAPDWIRKGGKDGRVLLEGNPEKSELFKRLLLPLEDEDHMPPKEKKQLTPEEISYLHWWIKQGGDFNKQVHELAQTDSIKVMLKSFERNSQPGASASTDLPPEPEKEADIALVDSLEKLGLLVLPLAESSHNLEISFLNCTLPPDSILPRLQGLSPQLLVLNLAGKRVSDTGMSSIAKLSRLRKLYLDHSAVSDQGLRALTTLRDLRYLNLTHTRVTAAGLAPLRALPEIRSIYLFGSQVKREDWATLQQQFPGVHLDSGGYRLPLLASDTEIVKEKKKK